METVKGLFSGLGGRISGRIVVAREQAEAKRRVQSVFKVVDQLHNDITMGERRDGRITVPYAEVSHWQSIPELARDYLELGAKLESDPTIFILTHRPSSASRLLTIAVGEIGRGGLGPYVQAQINTYEKGHVHIKLSCEIGDQLPQSALKSLRQIEQKVKSSLSEGDLESDELAQQMAAFAHNQLGINRYLGKGIRLGSEA